MEVKTLVFDMDGTLLNEKKVMDQVMIKYSKEIQAAGLDIIIASGRLDFMVYSYLTELGIDTPVIGCNGAIIRKKGDAEPIYANYMPLEELYQLIDKAKELDLLFHVFTTDCLIGLEHAGRLAYYSDTNSEKIAEEQVPIFVGEEYLTEEYLKKAIKFLIVSTDEEPSQKFAEYAKSLDLEVVSSGDDLVDVMSKGINKGFGLQKMAELGLIDLETTMAFGDNYNDLEMLSVVKYPIVMENAVEEIKGIAYEICGSCDDNGCGNYVVEKFLK